MPSISSIKADIAALGNGAWIVLSDYLAELIHANMSSSNFYNECKEARFSKGCPHCGSIQIVKNGKVNGKQRYRCKECNKTFGDLTKSVLSSTKLPLDKWA